MSRKKAIAISHLEEPWRNVDFVKDCGLIPYLLHRDHGMDVTMAGVSGGPYPYLDMTKGLRMEFTEDGGADLFDMKKIVGDIYGELCNKGL